MTDRDSRSRWHALGRALLGAVAVTLACTSDDASRAAIHRDSAGIAIHEHPASPPAGSVIRLRGVEAVSIGALEGSEAETFNQIRDLAADAEGRLHVLDAGDQIVKVYDPDGRWVARYGGEGEGPAEFQRASLLIPMADSMGVYDYRNLKIAVFGSDGSLLATRRFDLSIFEYGFSSMLTPIPGGLAGVFQTGCRMPPPGDRRPTWTLLTLGPGGAVKDTVTVRYRRNTIPLYGDRFCSVMPRLAGPSNALAVQPDGTAAFTAGREYEVSLFRLSALGGAEGRQELPRPERIIRRDLEPAPVTAAEIEEYRERHLTAAEDRPNNRDWMDAVREALDSTAIPERHPQIGALLWDDRGRLWVGRAGEDPDANRTWDVYDEAGRLVAEVVLPAHLQSMTVSRDMAWGTVRDELGVMYVKGFRLEEPAEATGTR